MSRAIKDGAKIFSLMNDKAALTVALRKSEARIEALQKDVAAESSLSAEWREQADSLSTALEQAKAREAELLGALEPFLATVDPCDLAEPDGFFTGTHMSIHVSKDDLRRAFSARNAVTAMGGDDNG